MFEPPSTSLSAWRVAGLFALLFALLAIGAAAAAAAGALAIVLLGLLAALALSFTELRYGVVLVLTALVFLPAPFSVKVGGATLTVGRLLLVVLLVAWFTQRHRLAASTARASPLEPFFWVVVLAQVAALIANVPTLRGSGLAAAFSRVGVFAIELFLLHHVVTLAFRRRRDALRLVRYIAGLISVVGGLGLVEWVTGRNVFEFLAPVLPDGLSRTISALADASVLQRGAISRVHSTLEHPLGLAVLLLIGLPLAASFALAARTRAERARWTVASVGTGAALLFTASRGAYLILLPMIVTMVVLSPDRRARVGLAVATTGFVGLALLTPDVRDTMAFHLKSLTVSGQRGGSVEQRTSAYSATVDLLGERPFFGFGPGTFTARQLKENGLLSDRVGVPVLDNGYLELAAETGAVGLVALVGALFAAALMTFRVWRDARSREDRLLGAALVASVEAWILFAFFADVYGYHAPPRVFFALLGIVAVLRVQRVEEAMPESETVGAR